jgi:CubicO group peptidase (beta-lactamase class C family)
MTAPDQSGTTLANWQDPPFNRWSFLHLDRILATRPIRHGMAAISALAGGGAATAEEIESLAVVRPDGTAGPVADVLADTETDGVLVLHDGAVVYEEYPSMPAAQPHLLMSVTKSLVGGVTATLIDRGVLDRCTRVVDVVPETRGSGYAEATVGDLLDMRSGVRFSEAYDDPASEVRQMEHAIGWRPHVPGVPTSLHEYLTTLEADRPHGGVFEYRSAETNMLGWVCERAGGAPMPDLLGDLVWAPLGAEFNAFMTVDPTGAAIHDGGLAATLRDVARFGQALLDDGRSLTGEQVLPGWWVADSLAAAPDSRWAYAHSPTPTTMTGGHYRNQLWVPYPDREVLLCLGIHGQLVVVDRSAGTVGVKLSTWPTPLDPVRSYDTLAAFQAITAHLRRGRVSPRE